MESIEKLEQSLNKPKETRHKVPLIPRFLKFMKKISELEQYDDYLDTITPQLIDWFFETLILRPFLIYLVLITTFFIPSIKTILFSEGISILWFLIVNLKEDLFK